MYRLSPVLCFFADSFGLTNRYLALTDIAYSTSRIFPPCARPRVIQQVSMFHFLLTEASCNRAYRPAHCELRKLPAAGPWLRDPLESVAKFLAWVRDMHDAFPIGSRHEHLFGARSHGNERDAWYNASQVSWLVDAKGTYLVDDIIKLEELEERWPALQRAICGLAHVSYASDAELRKNPSKHAHYSMYYDEETKRIVEMHMGVDLNAFGYRFEVMPASRG